MSPDVAATMASERDGFRQAMKRRAAFCSAGLSDPAGQQLAGDARNRRLARSVDVEHQNRIGIAECVGEFIQQQLRARVAMRLKDNVDLAEATLPRRSQRGADLRGMMSVVVDHGHAVALIRSIESGGPRR